MCFGQSGGVKENLAKDANSPQHVVVVSELENIKRTTRMDFNKATEGMDKPAWSILVNPGEKKNNSFAWILCLSYLTRVQPGPVAFLIITT